MGRRFSGAATELALAGYPGLHLTAPPGAGTAYGVYWPALVPGRPGGPRRGAAPTAPGWRCPTTGTGPPPGPPVVDSGEDASLVPGRARGPRRRAVDRRRRRPAPPAGPTVAPARSGPSSGPGRATRAATPTSGLWARSDEAWAWLDAELTLERFRELLPEADGLAVQRHAFPNLRALNFVVVGLLGEGVASSTRPDPQAKGLGEYLRSRLVDIPVHLLPGAS